MATAIENARLFERTVQAAEERERLLARRKEVEVARAGLEREFELCSFHEILSMRLSWQPTLENATL
jgi:GAF domain-containing protein